MKTFYRYIIPVLIILIGFVFIIIDKDNQHMHLKAFKSSKYKDIEYRDVQLDTMRAKVLIKFNNEQRLQTFIPLTSDETKMLQFSTLLIYDDSLGYQNIIMLSDWFPSDITQKCLSEIGAPLLKQLCGSILYLRPNDENSIIRAIKLNN